MNNKEYDCDVHAKQLSEERKDIPPGMLPHDAMSKVVFANAEMLKSFLHHCVGEYDKSV